MVSLSTWLEVKPKSSLLTLMCRAIGHRQTNEIRIALRDKKHIMRNTQTHKEKKMVSNKNAYEIRTEILEMAKTFVMDKFQNEKANWEHPR